MSTSQLRSSRACSLVLFAVLACAIASTAVAQTNPFKYGDPIGTISVSGVPEAYEPMITAGSFTGFDFYIITQIDFADVGLGEQNESNGILAWEALALIPPEMVVLSRVLLQPRALTVGSQDNWIVGLGDGFQALDSPLALVHYSALFTQDPAPVDLVVDLGPADPTSFRDAPAPGWYESQISGECLLPDGTSAKCLRLFAHVRGMRVNCTADCTVATENGSWGGLKSRY